MLDQLKVWATTHWVLWPSVLVVLIVFGLVLAWSRNQAHHSRALYRHMATTLLLGLGVIGVGIVDDLPSWVRRGSVISCLGVLMIISSLFSFVIAHRWVDQVAREKDSAGKKELSKLKESIGTKIGVLPNH